ncbi:hypothetical protein [Sulfurospirillum halorespirans]|uniref:hypothetical protein n=1 Tax=Sulfurospirillum halorespirans TaxID=194424 RepID=UPI000849F2B6|nr:hypothetical protein [Sulfurospirillum halorespirans]
MSDLEKEELFEDYLEKCGSDLCLHYVEGQYLLLDYSGQCVSKRYKNVLSLMSWFKKNMGE